MQKRAALVSVRRSNHLRGDDGATITWVTHLPLAYDILLHIRTLYAVIYMTISNAGITPVRGGHFVSPWPRGLRVCVCMCTCVHVYALLEWNVVHA